jgi:origin recognition complex subunit 3
LGVATTADVLQRFLPSNALSRLVPCGFTLKSPLERLESVVRAVLVDSFSAFEISHVVVKHLHMHFLRHDLTVTSFIMSLKVGNLIVK